MSFFRRVFGKQPDLNDLLNNPEHQYEVVSQIAATLDAFVAQKGLTQLFVGDWAIVLIGQAGEHGASLVRLDLPQAQAIVGATNRTGPGVAARLGDLAEYAEMKAAYERIMKIAGIKAGILSTEELSTDIEMMLSHHVYTHERIDRIAAEALNTMLAQLLPR
jgi:hypothetical protein